MSKNRYIVTNRSISSHCCFEATVMDSTKPDMIGDRQYEDKKGKHYESICECFYLENAIKIAKALNQMEGE